MAEASVAEVAAGMALYAADIYALQYRLSRCIQFIAPLLSSATPNNGASASKAAGHPVVIARHVRRLGDLLRETKQLNARIEEREACDAGSPSNVSANDSEQNTADGSLRAYYDQQLRARYAQMQQDMVTAEGLLLTCLASTPGLRGLPVNCVGTVPRQLRIVERDGLTHTCCVYPDPLTPAAARLPVPATYCVDRDPDAVLKTRSSPKSSAPQPAIEKSASEKRTVDQMREVPAVASASFSQTTAEDRIMADIQEAIHQMKDGALQVSAMMEQERSQMKSAAELLSGGVAKTQADIQALDRVSYVAASKRVPWVLSFIPGMPLLWRTVLQPMWAFMKQVLLMASILAITLCVLSLMSVLPKPVLFRGQRTARPAAPLPPLHPTTGHDIRLPASFSTAVPPPGGRCGRSPTVGSAGPDAPSPMPTAPKQEHGSSQWNADGDDGALASHPAPPEMGGDL